MSLGGQPVVSVCLPTYNRSKMLREAVASVLSQTLHNFELIVSDNASEDDTEEVVRSFKDPRIVYMRNSRNIGMTANINKCFATAKGEFIALCPDDDLMLPSNLARKVELLKRVPTMGLVHSRFHVVDEHGTIVRADTNWGHGPERELDAVEPGRVFLRRMLTGFCEVNPVTAVFRRACFERLGGFDESFRHTDDYEYWMRLAVYYDVGYVAEPLAMWRVHSQTHTSKYMAGGKTGSSAESLRDQLRAKHKILNTYKRDIVDAEELRRLVRLETGERVAFQADSMLDHGTCKAEVRKFLRSMARTFPCLLTLAIYWKTRLKASINRRGIDALKKLRHSISH
ncbi:MAG: glycosyltransferase [Nitrospirota bacterium]